MIEIVVPLPPSANRMWRKSGKRIHKSSAYTLWLSRAAFWISSQGFEPFDGYVRVDMEVPRKRRTDLDNAIKPTLDCLEAAGVYANDRQVRALWVQETDRPDMLVRVRALEERITAETPTEAVHGQERAA